MHALFNESGMAPGGSGRDRNRPPCYSENQFWFCAGPRWVVETECSEREGQKVDEQPEEQSMTEEVYLPKPCVSCVL